MKNAQYFIYESYETYANTVELNATTEDGAKGDTALLWNNFTKAEKAKCDRYALCRVPAGTEVDIGNDECVEIYDFANPTLEGEKVCTIEDLADFINEHGALTMAQEDEIKTHDTLRRLFTDCDFVATDGYNSVVMHGDKAVVVNIDADDCIVVAAGAYAEIPAEVWNEIPAAVRDRMCDNETFYCYEGDISLNKLHRNLAPAKWREGGFDWERITAEEALDILKAAVEKYIGAELLAKVTFKMDTEASELRPDTSDLVELA